MRYATVSRGNKSVTALAAAIWLVFAAALSPAEETGLGPVSTADTASSHLDALRGQVMQLLSQAAQDADADSTQRLDTLIVDLVRLRYALSDPGDVTKAHNLELRVRYGQAVLAQMDQDDREAAYRVGQLRTGAWRANQIPTAAAAWVSGFWLLQADLFDLNRTGLDLEARQRRAMDRLGQFLAEHRGLTDDSLLVERDVRLSLLRLYDERGESGKVKDLVQHVRRSWPDDQTAALLKRQYGYTDILGTPFDVQLTTANGELWSSHRDRGSVLLLSFRSEGQPPWELPPDAAPLADRIAQLDVIVDPWPVSPSAEGRDPVVPVVGRRTYRQERGGVMLSRQFMVKSVPRLVLIGADGRVEAVGGASITDTVKRLVEAADVGVESQPGANPLTERPGVVGHSHTPP